MERCVKLSIRFTIGLQFDNALSADVTHHKHGDLLLTNNSY